MIGEAARAILARFTALVLGPSSERVAKEPPGGISSLTVTTVHGYDVILCCEASYMERCYTRFYVPSRFIATYRVYAMVPLDAPERLRTLAGNFSMTIPRRYGSLAQEPAQKRAALQSYLDALFRRLERRIYTDQRSMRLFG
ncbi:hypothetical protein [Paraburkholderia sp. BCC1886]|uniref:hypothetical protein n=1 Tax=Paraburkholderia sp. BCC1886 TaxID=2562670 RepID=UPI001183E8D2|nr:hypothetical protein [Paraburkholderia sp. BCC1886]